MSTAKTDTQYLFCCQKSLFSERLRILSIAVRDDTLGSEPIPKNQVIKKFVKLPNGDRAIVDIFKLSAYCLNADHEDGKHKARVFASSLGLRRVDAEWLRDRLLEAAVHQPAELVSEIPYGRLYVVDSSLHTAAGGATVRSGWIVRAGEDFPQLTTCYVK
jgi:hypothetical protein